MTPPPPSLTHIMTNILSYRYTWTLLNLIPNKVLKLYVSHVIIFKCISILKYQAKYYLFPKNSVHVHIFMTSSLPNMDNRGHLAYPFPPSSCPHGYWMTPYLVKGDIMWRKRNCDAKFLKQRTEGVVQDYSMTVENCKLEIREVFSRVLKEFLLQVSHRI